MRFNQPVKAFGVCSLMMISMLAMLTGMSHFKMSNSCHIWGMLAQKESSWSNAEQFYQIF